MSDTSTTSNSNQSYTQNDGRSSTFGRNLTNFIQNKLPYSNISQDNDALNPKYKFFKKLQMNRSEALIRNSVSSVTSNNSLIGEFSKDTSFGDVMYANIQQDKGARIRDYRVIAAAAEVVEALDEICDETINIDENSNIVNLSIKAHDLTVREREVIDDEFLKYAEYFDLKNRGWQFFRQLLIEGELFFELIIHQDYLKDGVLGVINLPCELIDPVYTNLQNMLIKGYVYRKPVYSTTTPNKIERVDFVPMEENQIIYTNSGVFNESKTFVIPFLENARRPYRQLSLIEDSIVIYRLVRAPERLVFNVDTGNMPPPKAEAYMRKLIQNYWSKKTFDMDQNDVVKKFNPQSMLDAFWFAKRQGSEGTSVTQLPGGANLGELADLMYFVKKLYRSLKVPASRLDPEDSFKDGTEILREELKFAKFVVRQQQRFAASLKKGFIIHLKLKGLWEQYDLDQNNLEVEFNVPTNFYEMRESQRLELKQKTYSSFATDEFISATFAQKKYLGWKDHDILANREFLRKDAEFQWELAQISTSGPAWKEVMIAGDLGAGEGAEPGMPGVAPAPTGTPPDFGGGPADTSGAGAEAGTVPEAPPEPAKTSEAPPA